MSLDQMRDPARRDDDQQLERGLAPRVRGEGGAADADAGRAPGAPGSGGAEARGEGARAPGGDRAYLVGSFEEKERRLQLIRDALPGDRKTLQARTGLPPTTVWKLVDQLHTAEEIHIESWEPGTGPRPDVPTYALGRAEDAPNENIGRRAAAHAARKEARALEVAASAALREQQLRQKRAAPVRRDPMIEALFGPAPTRR